jgi:hypothetical protein
MKRSIIFCALLITWIFPKAQIITTIAGDSVGIYGGDGGPATAASFSDPCGISEDSIGNLYITDMSSWRVRIINTSDIAYLFAGDGNLTPPCGGNGGPATAANLSNASDVCPGKNGDIYIADWYNNLIRRVDKSGNISVVAGVCGSGGYNGDGIPATDAELSNSSGVFVDRKGNIFIADEENNRIRMVDSAGIIHTVAGNGYGAPSSGGFSGDGGPATNAELYFPFHVYVDSLENIYIADAENQRIRMVNTLGIINTVAGNGIVGFSGDGGPATNAELNYPTSVCMDNTGNLYIADWRNNRIREINKSGVISTIAGDSVQGYNGDGIQATTAELNLPEGVFVAKNGDIFISDGGNYRVRKISGVTGINELKAKNEEVRVYPNPGNGEFNLSIRNLELGIKCNLEVYNMLGQQVYSHPFKIQNSEFKIDLTGNPSGIYLYRVTTETGNLVGEGKLIKE